MVDHSWSHSFSIKPSAESKEEALWIFAKCRSFPLDERHYLLKNNIGEETIVSADVMRALSFCTRFLSLDSHASAIAKGLAMGEGAVSSIRSTLNDLCKRGYLISATKYLGNLQESQMASDDFALPKVFIRTSDRPGLLSRLLESCSQNEIASQAVYHYTIFDDSTDAFNQEKTSVACAAAAALGLNLNYFGPTQQKNYLDNLCDSLPEHKDVIRWLLGEAAPGQRYGRGWNFGLLLNAGSRYVMLDDDAILDARHAPVPEVGTRISDQPPMADFFESEGQVSAELKKVNFDPLAKHAQMLGHPLASVLTSSKAEDLVRDMEPSQVAALNGDSAIMMTANSVAGDPGTASAHWLFTLEADSLKKFTKNESEYRRNSDQRLLWRGRPEVQISHKRDLMSTTAQGVDNRQLLPPTIPAGRGEDGVFSQLVAYAYPNAVSLSFPWALLHLPDPARRWEADALDKPVNPNPASFIQDMARHHQDRCNADSPQARLATLAVAYTDLAAASDGRLAECVDEHRIHARASLVRQMQQSLKLSGPDFWQSDVRRIIQANSQMVAPSEPSIANHRAVLESYGQSLLAWPKIWEQARQIAHSNVT